MKPFRRRLLLLIAVGLLGAPLPTFGELVFSLHAAKAWVWESDLALSHPAGTDLTLEDVSWRDESFDSPANYELRLTWWSAPRPEWGVAVDFTHAKAILDTDETALARGVLAGQPIRQPVPVEEVLPELQFSHGLNSLTAMVLRRWRAAPRLRGVPGTAFYAGAGAGVALPHVEAVIDGVPTREYQAAGPVARALLGIEAPFDENIALLLEGALYWFDLEADLTGGGRVETELWTPQLTLGLAVRD